jgi:hypothetical protein
MISSTDVVIDDTSCNYNFFSIISLGATDFPDMLTSNLPFEEWNEVIGSERLTGALLDRITYRCHIIEANDDNYRLERAKNAPVKSDYKQILQIRSQIEERRYLTNSERCSIC